MKKISTMMIVKSVLLGMALPESGILDLTKGDEQTYRGQSIAGAGKTVALPRLFSVLLTCHVRLISNYLVYMLKFRSSLVPKQLLLKSLAYSF